MQMPHSAYARARLWGLKSLIVVRFLILVVRGTRASARTHMQILRERSRAPTGEKVHKSNRILHALLKKSCKTAGCLLKISDPSTRPIHFPVLAPYNIFEDI